MYVLDLVFERVAISKGMPPYQSGLNDSKHVSVDTKYVSADSKYGSVELIVIV